MEHVLQFCQSPSVCSYLSRNRSGQSGNSPQHSTKFVHLVLTSLNGSLTSKACWWAALHPEDFPPQRNPSLEDFALCFPQKPHVHLGAGSSFLAWLNGRERILPQRALTKEAASTFCSWGNALDFWKGIESYKSFFFNIGVVSERFWVECECREEWHNQCHSAS